MVRTGRLRGSITWRIGQDTRSPFVDVGTAVFYAPFVELGTSRSPAYPYLTPALEAARVV
jgi:phage gpG-like protein